MTRAIFQEQTKFRCCEALGGKLQVLSAAYLTQTFPRHTHDEFVIGVIEAGAEVFDYRGSKHIAAQGDLFVVSPGEVHTGRAADEAKGWAYRTLYIDDQLLQQAAAETATHSVLSFPQLVLQDWRMVQAFLSLHFAIDQTSSLLAYESQLLSFLVTLITRHSSIHQPVLSVGNENQAVKRVREYIESHYAQKISLDELGSVANLSKFHLLRAFSLQMGYPPHAYQEQVRINAAKRLLLQGSQIAQVAVRTGYVDQSHLTRRFKRFVGVTPGQFVQGQQ